MFIRFVTALSCFLIVSNVHGATASHTNTASRFGLDINGYQVGFLKSVEGGGIYADVVTEGSAANGAIPRHLGALHYEDLTVRVGLQENLVPNMIQALFAGRAESLDCRLMEGDFDGNTTSEKRFKSAILSEFTLPALDGASKDTGYFTLKLTPGSVDVISGGGSGTMNGKIGAKTKAWLTSNFRIDIDGIPCSRVARIEPLTVRMPVAGGAAALTKGETAKQPGALELPMIRLSVSYADAPAWRAWFDDFVLKGKNATANEKNGSITLLGPDMKGALLTFKLYNIGIARLNEAPREANSEQIRRLDAELYFERIEIVGAAGTVPAGASNTPPPADPVAAATSPTTSTAAAASQPAAPAPTPTASKPPTRMQTPITRTPVAATETDTYVIKPNLRLVNGAGRVVVRFPEGIRNRDNQRTLFPKTREEKNSEINWGSVAKEMPAGDYLVTLNGKQLENIKVQAGGDTQLRLGVLRIDVADNQSWELIEEDLDSAPAIFYTGGPADIALPVGTFYVRTKSQIAPVKIEDGKFTTFGPAPAAAPAPADAPIKK